MTDSMLGKWDYSRVHWPMRYGEDDQTYQKGMEWLAPCAVVEDWGCGGGWARKYAPAKAQYIGVDGSACAFTSKVADLVVYRSEVEGIFMRHVLEHNKEWAKILDNFMASFTKRAALIIFTPFRSETKIYGEPGIIDVLFRKEDLTERFKDARWREELVKPSKTNYGEETVFYFSRP